MTCFQPGTICRYVQRETTLVNIHVMKLEEAVSFFFLAKCGYSDGSAKKYADHCVNKILILNVKVERG